MEGTARTTWFTWLKRLLMWTVAYVVFLHGLDRLFDFVLYPFMIGNFGLLKGVLIMTILSGLICAGMLMTYQLAKVDIFAIEAAKDGLERLTRVDGRKAPSVVARNWWLWWLWPLVPLAYPLAPLVRLFAKAVRWGIEGDSKLGALVGFFYLSIATDPFHTVAWLRPRSQYRLRASDWIVFSTSLFVSNVGWALLIYGVISVLPPSVTSFFAHGQEWLWHEVVRLWQLAMTFF